MSTTTMATDTYLRRHCNVCLKTVDYIDHADRIECPVCHHCKHKVDVPKSE